MVSEYRSTIGGVTVNEYLYTYDENDNIVTIRNDYTTGQANYVYDEFDQLISEVNYDLGKTFTYTYDDAGNITSITTKDNSTGATSTVTYYYYAASTSWGDQLSSIPTNEYDSLVFSYDALGNISHYYSPYPYEDVYLTWEGRQLVSSLPDDNGGFDFRFVYDDEGKRIQKSTEGWIYTNYVYEGDLLLYETGTYGTIVYIYDGGSTPIGMMYRAANETAAWQIFWYEKNLQGDVVAVYDNNGVKQVSYTYDAWGNCTSTTHVSGTAATYNPIRYRSYYYDREINLYYLGARWYSARFHRFMSPDNVDVAATTPGALTDKNLYAYCDNNPVMRVDYTGEFWGTLFDVASLVWSIVDVCQNPDDTWAWIGLAFDIVDLLPIISGTGEVTDVLRFANTSDDAISEFLQAGGKIRKIRKYEVSKSGRALIKDLYKTSEGYTVSTHRIGTQIHKNFRRNGQTIPNFRLRVDGISEFWNSIYELKPNNPKSIQRGIQQLYQYRDAYKTIGKNYKMVLVLY